MEILKGLRARYESHHGVQIHDAALLAAARLSSRYISDRFLPDKAIDVMDEAASRVRLQISEPPEEVKRLRQELETVQRRVAEGVSVSPLERDGSRLSAGRAVARSAASACERNSTPWKRDGARNAAPAATR